MDGFNHVTLNADIAACDIVPTLAFCYCPTIQPVPTRIGQDFITKYIIPQSQKSRRLHLACPSSSKIILGLLCGIILGPFFPTCPPLYGSGFHSIPAEMTGTFCYRDRCPFRTWYKARHHALGFREFGHSTLDLGGQR